MTLIRNPQHLLKKQHKRQIDAQGLGGHIRAFGSSGSVGSHKPVVIGGARVQACQTGRHAYGTCPAPCLPGGGVYFCIGGLNAVEFFSNPDGRNILQGLLSKLCTNWWRRRPEGE